MKSVIPDDILESNVFMGRAGCFVVFREKNRYVNMINWIIEEGRLRDRILWKRSGI